jgi:hypothetical protein
MAGGEGNGITVEIVLALPERQELAVVKVPEGTAVGAAVELSGVPSRFPEIDAANGPVAVWGNVTDRQATLRDGDRIELLRPLVQDPRDARRKLAQEGQFMGHQPAGRDG